jgi:hypothetical protein
MHLEIGPQFYGYEDQDISSLLDRRVSGLYISRNMRHKIY